jgi:GNAT superfamily N-acetyltransferase
MKIEIVRSNRKKFLNLLLLADEKESMIDKYIERGDMFALYENDEVKSACVVTNEGQGIYELKNIATLEEFQRKGYGTQLLKYILHFYRGQAAVMYVGTGDNTSALSFYLEKGFIYSHRIRHFFTDNYDYPIFECGKQLVDMVYLKMDL